MLFDIANTPDKNCSPGLAFVQSQLCSPEEKLSINLRFQNLQRPEIEEGILIFKYLWRHRVLAVRQQAFMELQNRFWLKFILDMSLYARSHPYVLSLREEQGDVSVDLGFDKASVLSSQTKNTVIFDWIKQKSDQ